MTPDSFDQLNDAMRQATEAVGRTNAALLAAHDGVRDTMLGLLRAFEVSREARAEREDFRDTVRQLQELVLQLVADVRALRERNGDKGGSA